MNIILLEKIKKLGDIGDEVTVKSGYARNFLLPQGKAVFASKENIKMFEDKKAQLEGENIERKNMPIIGRATCNKIMWKPLLGALNQVIEEGLEDTLSKEEFQKSGGCYAPRRINRFNAGGAISRHAWGIAIDINVKSGYHPRVVEIFNSWGFAWGGTWTSPDEMHFELRDLSPSISQASG